MVTIYSTIALIGTFFFTLYLVPRWIFRARKAGLLGKDMHKEGYPVKPEAGGLPVICGFISGVLLYVAFKVILVGPVVYIIDIMAAITAVLIAAIIGLVDDILGWKMGLRSIHKLILTFAIAVPIMVVHAGDRFFALPFIGLVDLGIVFPFLVIPLIIMFTANAFNMLAGYNGLEAGMGIIILFTLSLIAYGVGHYWVGFLGIAMCAALAAFWLFNRFPAQVFPGDTLTYAVGALIGIVAVLGGIERYAGILLIPYGLQFLLKARGRMKKESFAELRGKGLHLAYKHVYGLEHIALRLQQRLTGRATERGIVFQLYGLQLVFAIFTFFLFLA